MGAVVSVLLLAIRDPVTITSSISASVSDSSEITGFVQTTASAPANTAVLKDLNEFIASSHLYLGVFRRELLQICYISATKNVL